MASTPGSRLAPGEHRAGSLGGRRAARWRVGAVLAALLLSGAGGGIAMASSSAGRASATASAADASTPHAVSSFDAARIAGAASDGSSSSAPAPLSMYVVLEPQSLSAVLTHGLSALYMSNGLTDGIVTISVPRATAHRAGIAVGRAPEVVVGRGTITGLRPGSGKLHVRLAHGLAHRLSRLTHAALTLHLALVDAYGRHLALQVTGSY